MNLMTSPSPLRRGGCGCVALLAVACSAVGYDFGLGEVPDAGDPSHAACLEVPLVAVECPAAAAECDGAVETPTEQLDAPVGCAPAGVALAVARIPERDGPEAMDLFAWVEPGPDDPGAFASGAALSLFGSKCAHPLGGEPGQNCAFEPHRVEPGLGLDRPLFLHVQTPRPVAVTVGIQALPREAWRAVLPAAGAPLSCSLAGGQILPDLANLPPWGGTPVTIDTGRLPPALAGGPWLCASSSGGWRQAAFLLRNAEDGPLRVTAVRLGLPGKVGAARFHFGLYRCLGGGTVASELDALASSCHDAGDHASKAADAVIEPWTPGAADTEYVLVLQVPPGPDRLFELIVESEPAGAR
jgi:hypothetical protein